MLFEKKPNLALKNKKGQTAIDTTNNKFIVSLFVQYFTNKPEKRKDVPLHIDTSQKHINFKIISEKIQIKEPEITEGCEPKKKANNRMIQGPKKHIDVFRVIKLFIAFQWSLQKSKN